MPINSTRRTFLRRAGLVGGVVAATPTTLDFARSPAAAASFGNVVASTSLAANHDLDNLTTYVIPEPPAAADWSATSGSVVLLLFQALDVASAAALSITVTGSGATPPIGAATEIASNQFHGGTQNITMWAWWAIATGNPGSVDVVINRAPDNLGWHFVELDGVETTTPIQQSVQTAGNGSPATASLASPAFGNGQLIFVGGRNAFPAWTTPTGYTELADFHVGDGADSSIATFFRSDAQASASISHTAGAMDWGTISLELNCI